MKNQNLSRLLLPILLPFIFLTSASALTTNFLDGFEGGLSNVWSVGDNNAIGTPAYWGVVNNAFGGEGTHDGTNKIYCAGVGFTGSSASPFYRDSMTAYLQRTVSLSNYPAATLSFWHKIPSLEACCDFARVYVNGTNKIWETSAAAPNWTNVNLNLTPYVGFSIVLKFEFFSDAGLTNEGWYLDDIMVTDLPPPPTNDNFSAALTIFNATGNRKDGNLGATAEANEPNPLSIDSTNTIWYKWTAPTNGNATFDTVGSSFDTILSIYTGSSLATLVHVISNDDANAPNGIFTSLVTFNASLGTTYRIQVKGYTNAAGNILLNWNQPNAVAADLLPDLSIWADQASALLYGWYLDRNEPTLPGHTLLRSSTATPNSGTGPLELLGSSASPDVYQRIYRANGTYWDHYAGTFTFHPSHGHLHFDNWMNYQLRAVLTNNGVGDIVVLGRKTSFNISDTTVYNLSLPGAPGSGHYPLGNSYTQGLSVGWADIYGHQLADQWIDVTDVPAGQYWLEGVVNPLFNILESNYSNNVSRILIDLSPVANDYFTNAALITGVTAGFFDSTDLATLETGEPKHAGQDGLASIWYKWTAPSNMSVTISTEGSSFDTLLAVYTGSVLSSLTPVASNNDYGTGKTSRVTFSAVNGTTYKIAVAGLQFPGVPGIGQKGFVQLHFNPAFNDAFASAIPITGLNGATSGSTRGATHQAGETNKIAGITCTNSIWYNWTATNTGPVTFDTIGSTYDTLLAVYTGAAVNALTVIAADHASAGMGASRVLFTATNGTTYRLAIDGSPGAFGIVQLNWSFNALPVITAQPASTNAYEGADIFFNVSVSGSAPFSYQWLYEGNPLSDTSYINGSTTASLSISKIISFDAGSYRVIVTNSFGSVTSAPAYLITIYNPRVAYAQDTTGPVGGLLTVPLRIQSLGDEHLINFSVVYDPTLLTNPRLLTGSNTLSAALTTNTSLVASGKFGGTVTLPLGQVLPAGNFEWARILFDTCACATNGTITPVGFGDLPVDKGAATTNGTGLVAIFYAGNMTLYKTTESLIRLSNGLVQINLTGSPNRSYIIEGCTNLANVTNAVWLPVVTNVTSAGGTLQFTDTKSTNYLQRFYRAKLVP